MEDKFFLVQIRCTDGTWSKGVVVNDSANAAKQGFHAYFGAYGYDHDPHTDYVQCEVLDMMGNILAREVDDRRETPEEE